MIKEDIKMLLGGISLLFLVWMGFYVLFLEPPNPIRPDPCSPTHMKAATIVGSACTILYMSRHNTAPSKDWIEHLGDAVSENLDDSQKLFSAIQKLLDTPPNPNMVDRTTQPKPTPEIF